MFQKYRSCGRILSSLAVTFNFLSCSWLWLGLNQIQRQERWDLKQFIIRFNIISFIYYLLLIKDCSYVCVRERERQTGRQTDRELGALNPVKSLDFLPLLPTPAVSTCPCSAHACRRWASSMSGAWLHPTTTTITDWVFVWVLERDLHPSPQFHTTEFKLFSSNPTATPTSPPLATVPWVNKHLGSGAKQSAPSAWS